MTIRRVWMLLAGLLALAASAPADIVWSGVQNLSGDYQDIDLNFDSLIDVSVVYSASGDASVEDARILAYVDGVGIDGSNRILVSSEGFDVLPLGSVIGEDPGSLYEWGGGTYFAGYVSSWVIFLPNNPQIPPSESSTEWEGPLGENGNAYIGLEFDIAGTNHYGWVNIALGTEEYLGFRDPIVTSWAYESTPNTAIVAGAIPEPSTGILTVGGSISLLLLARSRRGRQSRGLWR